MKVHIDRCQALTLGELTKLIEPRPHINSVRRWARKGCRGSKLRTWFVGGRLCSSLEAWDEFSASLNNHAPTTSESHIDAERKLQRMGI